MLVRLMSIDATLIGEISDPTRCRFHAAPMWRATLSLSEPEPRLKVAIAKNRDGVIS